ncbi:hypothetical protein ACROYT_G009271 [Oculina patagonica]
MSPFFLGILWLCTQFIMSSQTEPKVCGVARNTLQSPGYPNDYQNATLCMYLVPIPPGMAMNISFRDFELEGRYSQPECIYDYLKIFNDQYKEYGVYCGEMTGQTVLVNGRHVVIIFGSDKTVQERGFLLHFTAVPIVCGSVVNNTLKSPGYPNNYQNVTDCIYVVPIPPGMAMNVSFKDFELEDDATCRFDFLKITNEYNDNSTKHCGKKTGQAVIVTGDHVVLIFHTDDDREKRGFLLFFTAIPQEPNTTKADLRTSVSTRVPPMASFPPPSLINSTKTISIPTQTATHISMTESQNASNPSNRLSRLVIMMIAVGGGVTAVIIGVAVLWKENNNKVQKKNDKWEVKSDDVTICEELGHGAFGKVCKGIMKVPSLKKKTNSAITVAVKMLQENATPDQKKDFLDEINLMKAVGSHKNIVSLIGCCIKSSPNFLIVEFASKGDLLSYLRERRKKVKDTKAAAYVDVQESRPPPISLRFLNQNDAEIKNKIGANCTGEVNIAFSKTKSSTHLISAQALFDEEQVQDENEDDSLTSQDMMSFSWQIAQGMVGEKKFNPVQV